jgi:transposase
MISGTSSRKNDSSSQAARKWPAHDTERLTEAFRRTVLGYSRFLHVDWVPWQTALTVIQALERAFTAFGGVPQELLFDKMKSLIVEDHRGTGGRLHEDAAFARCDAHWGFRIRACRPCRAKAKGKVERVVNYLRGNFVYGRNLLGDGDLAAQTVDCEEAAPSIQTRVAQRQRIVLPLFALRASPRHALPSGVVGVDGRLRARRR